MPKTILVTGAAGFLGVNLCRRLLEEGNFVIGLDNFATGQRRNTERLSAYKNFVLEEADVRQSLSGLEECEQIYNLACPASPPKYQADPIFTLETSVLGVRNLLGLANQWGARMLQASTSEVYGDPAVSPQAEEYWGNVNPVGIRSCYDEGKRVAETFMSDSARAGLADTRIVRIFNTYGPGMDPQDGRVISNFIVQALAGSEITVYGDGTQTRSFCFVDDLVDGLVRVMNNDQIGAEPINLGNPNEFTMLQLAEEVLSIVTTKSKLKFEQLPADDPKQRKPNIQKVQALTGWQPSTQLREGLTRTVKYFTSI